MPKLTTLKLVSLLLCLLYQVITSAQATLSQAAQYVADKNYEKAIEAYEQLYSLKPDSVYTPYLNTLIAAKKYKAAEKLVAQEMTLSAQNFTDLVDLGAVYEAEGKTSKALDQYNALVDHVNGDDLLTQRIARTFENSGHDTFAIRTYERAIQILTAQNAYIYSVPLSRLYTKTGNITKAIEALLAEGPGQYLNVENAKSQMLEIFGEDPEKLRQAQKAMIKKINEQPENTYYALLLTWIFTQRNDWDGALMQIEAIDARNKENGRRLMEFGRTAVKARQYETAVKAFDDVIAYGPAIAPAYYVSAKSEKLTASLDQLENTPNYSPDSVKSLEAQYDSFLAQYPKNYSTQTASDYAQLEAKFANNAEKGIDILNKAIHEPDTKRTMMGQFKLQLGDYEVLVGKLWDASLIYSQVDKEFKEDAMGEDARFRNAKLAYYMGDFDWAQHQLNILKAATSELIANDALYLSVLITENVEDSNTVPLQRFANAGLLLFQNKDKEAETLLDSINMAYPTHPLNDDILMLRAEIGLKHLDYTKALGYLKEIYDKYHDDVLGDDAVFKMAEIYQEDLHQPDQAKHYYEQLILDYPGSTFVQTARQRLSELTNGANP